MPVQAGLTLCNVVLRNLTVNSSVSEHFDDQTRLYSTQPQLRPILFKEEDITANIVEQISLTSRE